jgi:hypothetical protein
MVESVEVQLCRWITGLRCDVCATEQFEKVFVCGVEVEESLPRKQPSYSSPALARLRYKL